MSSKRKHLSPGWPGGFEALTGDAGSRASIRPGTEHLFLSQPLSSTDSNGPCLAGLLWGLNEIKQAPEPLPHLSFLPGSQNLFI